MAPGTPAGTRGAPQGPANAADRCAALTAEVAATAPATAALLEAGGLLVHPRVRQINLAGSRGPDGSPRPDSDIDLSLLVDDSGVAAHSPDHEALLRDVLQVTLDAWRGEVELDLAALFDQRSCGLACLDSRDFSPEACPTGDETGRHGGVDCCGVYKLQRGFSGYVPPIGVRMELVHPTLVLWRRGA